MRQKKGFVMFFFRLAMLLTFLISDLEIKNKLF